MIIDKLLANICNEEKDRQWSNPVRLSASGKCQRAIVYQLIYPDKMLPLTSRSRMVFRLGDTIEAEVKALLRKYPSDGVELFLPEVQEEVKVTVSGQEILGHIDGRAKINGEDYLLEVKSINGMGYRRVLKGYIGKGYEAQTTAYMKALGVNKTLFIFYCKDTSHICEVIFNYIPEIWEQVERRFRNVLKATAEELPDREYRPNAKGVLPWQCSYCSAVKLCWPTHELKFDDNSKPQLIVAEREPDEVNN